MSDLRRRKRSVVIEGEIVSDPTRHPASKAGAHVLAARYDHAAAFENRSVASLRSPARRLFGLVRFRKHRRTCAQAHAAGKRAELTFGLMGRTPEHIAGFFCGFAKPSVLEAASFIVTMNRFRSCDFERAGCLVSNALNRPPLADQY